MPTFRTCALTEPSDDGKIPQTTEGFDESGGELDERGTHWLPSIFGKQKKEHLIVYTCKNGSDVPSICTHNFQVLKHGARKILDRGQFYTIAERQREEGCLI